MEVVARGFGPKVVVTVTVVRKFVGALETVISHPQAGFERTVLDGTKVLMIIGDSTMVYTWQTCGCCCSKKSAPGIRALTESKSVIEKLK